MAIGFGDASVLVVGDSILDIYAEGAVSRVSPEAPVPVVHLSAERMVPGGAANVAANIATLGGRAGLATVLGRDGAARDFRAVMGQKFPAVELSGCLDADDRPTITKTRIIGNQHQITRIDREKIADLSGELQQRFLSHVEQALEDYDVLVMSDYGKGICCLPVIRALVEIARRAGKPLLIDPKRADLAAYSGASVISPNRRELTLATGLPCESDGEAERAAARAIELTGASILLTRSERGMSFFAAGQPPLHVPTASREVFDVSGAGDTVLAVFAMCVGKKLPIAQSLALANGAAAVVVGKAGTATVTPAELARQLAVTRGDHDHLAEKIMDRDEAAEIRDAWRAEGLTVGFTNGCFDLLHPGHISLLRQAAAKCDRLIVALNSDASVRRLKGPERPMQNEAARATVMAAIGVVDLVTIFDEDTPQEIIDLLLPDVLVKGADYTVETVVGADTVMQNGGKVVLVDLIANQSTTKIISRSKELA